jgi:hypothetical protein
MWEMILSTIIAFLIGWEARKVIDRKTDSAQQLGKPELMWFNEKKSRWDRVTSLQLLSGWDRVVVEIPVKLVEERKEKE